MAKWKSKANWKDRNWKYVPAASTDISLTIERVKREMIKLKLADETEKQTKEKTNLLPLKRKTI